MGSLQPIRASVRQLMLKPPEPGESHQTKNARQSAARRETKDFVGQLALEMQSC